MSEQYVGCTVSVKCIEEIGTYQGQIVDLNKDSVTLSRAFCNGVPQTSPVVLSVKDILDVEFIAINDPGSIVSDNSQGQNKSTSSQLQSNFKKADANSQFIIEQSANGKIPLAESVNKPTQKRLNHRQRALERDEHTFGTPIDQSLSQDFDFEKNLALFDKEAVWQEINSLKPDSQTIRE